MKSNLQNSRKFAGSKALISLAMAFVCLVLAPEPVLCEEQKAGSASGLSVSVDRDEAQVGETVELTLSFQLPEGATLTEDIKIKGLDDLTVLEIRQEHDVVKVMILIDKLGTLKSGPIELLYIDTEGKKMA